MENINMENSVSIPSDISVSAYAALLAVVDKPDNKTCPVCGKVRPVLCSDVHSSAELYNVLRGIVETGS